MDTKDATGRRHLVTGEGLVLRPAHHDDLQRWFELYEDPDEQRYGTPTFVVLPTSVQQLEPRVEESRLHFDDRVPGRLVVAAEAAPAHLLGVVDWRQDVPAPFRTADVGYAVHPDARGRGVGTRALRLLTRWLLVDEGGPHQVRAQLDHSVENGASCRVATGAGYEREGVRRAFLPLRDPDAPGGERRHDVCLHGRLAPELEQASGTGTFT
ncbi:GNAT family N-acetyltransferase [Nocardioides aurantiacus]|uniref:RimJ/RimL family protein N-acetyltransferase n=1 Tax=Nocardioides aurantiacus TaxID=86796 RepID=A0A3N2CRL9_9ACTN|nr:GNAT family protein [Nocardioides aurantiacus]ROR90193.1 RimJ/RimL family protein N-acetyltransferase [Nocardioides aurantiacus]